MAIGNMSEYGLTSSIMSKRKKVLIVEDDSISRKILSQHFLKQNYNVFEAGCGDGAFEVIADNDIDVILLDISLPGIDGITILKKIKEDPHYDHIPVIMVSGNDDINIAIECIHSGASDYISKPYNPMLIQQRVNTCLREVFYRKQEQYYIEQLKQEREKSEDLLRVVYPSNVLQELKYGGVVNPKWFSNVAVLFCDIVDFSSYCNRNSTVEVVSKIQKMVELYEDLMEKHHLELIKTIGDCFMCVGGLLKQVENPVLQCIKCGFDMVEIANKELGWDVRVGIHVGEVMAGIIGKKNGLFDLWGDTVNIASKCERFAEVNSVVVSPQAQEYIKDIYVTESYRKIDFRKKNVLDFFKVFSKRSK
jgi:adenylate cyclase